MAVVALLVAVGVSAVPAPARGQQAGIEVRITAQRLESGRVEFALEQRGSDGEWGERLLPSRRFFPTGVRVRRWLVSSPLTVGIAIGGGEAEVEVRITAQRLESGRVEFALEQRGSDGEWGERLLPSRRFFPTGVRVRRWLVSSPLAPIPDRPEAASFSIGDGPRSGDRLIAASNSHTCAVRLDWGLTCWGHEGPRNNLSAATLDDVVTVSVGNHPRGTEFHTCVLHENRTVSCWGTGTYGQHGHPEHAFRYLPAEVPGIDDARALAVGSVHTCVVHHDGGVSCWGQGTWGQLGNGVRDSRSSPERVPGVSGAVTIAAGVHATCAVHSDGALSCWGEGVADTPRRHRLAETADSVAVGSKDACAASSTGRVYCWQLAAMPRPALVAGLSNVVAVSVGAGNACAVHRDGTVSCWGENNSAGQLGDGTKTPRETPRRVAGISDAVAVTVSVQSEVGEAHACVVHRDGPVSCWGSNGVGQLGHGSNESSPIPRKVRFSDPLQGAEAPTDRTVFLRLWLDAAVREWEVDHPWLGLAWNHIRDRSVAVETPDELGGLGARVNFSCQKIRGAISCGAESLRMFLMESRLAVHELAHVFDYTTSLVSSRTWGAVQLFFAANYPDCYPSTGEVPLAGNEILADTITHVVLPDGYLHYFELGECPDLSEKPSQEAVDVVRTGLAGHVPGWYVENIVSGADLWAVLSNGFNFAALANLTGEFGGLCTMEWIEFPINLERFPPADADPFRDGGC